MTPESSSPTPSETPRRGCFGCLLTTGLGCGAFGVGALGAVVLFAPSLLGGFFRRVLVSEWNDAVAGRVRLESLELSWTSAVELRGLEIDDPEGNLVAALDLSLPPLFTLIDDGATAWNVTAALRTLDVELEEGGGTNLARALAPDPASGGGRTFIRMGSFDSRNRLDQPFDITVALEGREVLVRAESAPEPILRLDTIEGSLVHRPGRTDIDLGGQIEGGPIGGGGRFGVEANWGRGWWDAETRLDLDAGGLPTAIVDHLFAADGALQEAFGPELTVDLFADRTVDDRVSLTLDGAGEDRLVLDARIAEGRLEVGEDGRLEGRCRLPGAWVAALVGDELPAGLRIDADGTAWDFHTPGLHASLSGLADARRFDPRGQIVLEHDGALDLVEDTADGAPRDLHRLVDPRLTLTWPGDGADPGPDGGSSPGGPRVELIERAGLARLVELPADGGGRRWRLVAPGLDSDVVAGALGLGGVDGLLDGLLDRRVDLEFEGRAGAGRLSLEGSEGRTSVRGRVDGSTLVADEEEGDRALLTLDLDDERHRAWLQAILPWYASVAKPAGAAPAELTLTEFELPFSGDFSKLKASAELELRRVECVARPSLAKRFASEEPFEETFEETFGTISFEVGGELIRYGDDLELVLDGEFYPFTGSHDLQQRMVFLSGEIAARYVSEAAPGVEDVFVKVSLHGPPDALALTVDPQVYEAMKSGLSTLLELLADDGE